MNCLYELNIHSQTVPADMKMWHII